MENPQFRVWDMIAKRWYPKDNIAIDNLGNTFVFGLNTDEVDLEGRDIYAVSLINDADKQIIELFSGLYDKNKKAIYKGDIVAMDSWNPKNVQIKFIEGAFCLAFIGGEFDGDFAGDIHYIHHAGIPQATVIGNIHENPNLLTT